MSDIARLFPLTSEKSSSWWPIYLEPIVQSGERFCVAIAARNDTRFLVVRTIPLEKLQCFFGINAERINDLVQLAIETVETHLEIGLDNLNVQFPFDGLMVGGQRHTNLDSLEQVVNVAISFCSSIGLMIDSRPEILETNDIKVVNQRWISKIRTELKSRNESLDDFFNVEIDVQEQKSIKYDFVNNNFASNFGYIDFRRLSLSTNTTEAKLLQLQILRESKSLLVIPEKIELILGVPKFDDPTISPVQLSKIIDSVEILKTFSASHNVKLVTVENSDQAADYLYSQVS